MPTLETVEHALISVNNKEKAPALAAGLIELGGWEVHAYEASGTKAVLEDHGLPVSNTDPFIGHVDPNDRMLMADRLSQHLRRTPEELTEAGLPSIDLLYMNPKLNKRDRGYVDMMEAAISTQRILVVSKMCQVAPILEWVGIGRPESHEISIKQLNQTAEEEIAEYLHNL